jgi:hypothetical protein
MSFFVVTDLIGITRPNLLPTNPGKIPYHHGHTPFGDTLVFQSWPGKEKLNKL